MSEKAGHASCRIDFSTRARHQRSRMGLQMDGHDRLDLAAAKYLDMGKSRIVLQMG